MILWNTLRTEINPRSREYVAPPELAVSIPVFKEHIKWDLSDKNEDNLMDLILNGVTKEAELYTRRVISLATWRTYLESFYDFCLDVVPVNVSTLVIKYYDDTDTEATLNAANYVITDRGPDDFCEVVFKGTLPTLYDRKDAVFLEYQAGYEDVPYVLKNAILRQAATFFETRTTQVNGSIGDVDYTFHKMLFPYKMLR